MATKKQAQPTGRITEHLVREGDARDLSFIETESVHLVVTSPPYAMLKEYPDHPGQMATCPSTRTSSTSGTRSGRSACGCWCLEAASPALSEMSASHAVDTTSSLSADIQSRVRPMGFDNLTPIRWLSRQHQARSQQCPPHPALGPWAALA